MTYLKTMWITVVVAFLATTPIAAQSLFETVATVNNDTITRYELDQRQKFFRALNRPSSTQAARDSLIEDKLRLQEARRAGFAMNDEQRIAEMERFAGRANLTLAELTQVLARSGVDQAALRDFVEPSVLWREVVRTRFSAQGQVSDAEVDRALGTAGPGGGLRVLLSEIILFAPPPERAAQRAVAERLTNITSISRFAAEARARSVAESRANGGRLPWTNLADLPAPLQPIVSRLRPGEVSQILTVENAFILFQLRDVAETPPTQPQVQSLEYAQMNVPTETLNTVMARLDVCDDFFGEAKRAGIENFALTVLPAADVPNDIAASLSTLDPFETTTRQVGVDTTQVTMLCGRTFAANQDQSRQEVADQLRQRRLSSLSEGFLAELRASADIVIK